MSVPDPLLLDTSQTTTGKAQSHEGPSEKPSSDIKTKLEFDQVLEEETVELDWAPELAEDCMADNFEVDEPPISTWKSVQADPSEFVRRLNSYDPLYYKPLADWEAAHTNKELAQLLSAGIITPAVFAHQRATPAKERLKPMAQLHLKGIALLSSLYAIQDQDERQPLIASTIGDFKYLISLIATAPCDIEVTVIVQFTDFPSDLSVHKSAVKIRKTGSAFKMVHMDAISSTVDRDIIWPETIAALRDAGLSPGGYFSFAQERFDTKPALATSAAQPKMNHFVRQDDTYACGVFARSDADEMNQMPDFIDEIFREKNLNQTYPDHISYLYKIPAVFLKMIQSRAYAEYIMPTEGHKVVTKEGKTLQEIHAQYDKQTSYYSRHVNEEHLKIVWLFVTKEENRPKLQAMVAEYDTGKITAKRLQERYRWSPTEATHERKIALEKAEPATMPNTVNTEDTLVLEQRITSQQVENEARVEKFYFDFLEGKVSGLEAIRAYAELLAMPTTQGITFWLELLTPELRKRGVVLAPVAEQTPPTAVAENLRIAATTTEPSPLVFSAMPSMPDMNVVQPKSRDPNELESKPLVEQEDPGTPTVTLHTRAHTPGQGF